MTTIPGGFWFKDHCLKITPNKKTEGIRYRYPEEDWITVEGDDYSIEPIEPICEDENIYSIVYVRVVAVNNSNGQIAINTVASFVIGFESRLDNISVSPELITVTSMGADGTTFTNTLATTQYDTSPNLYWVSATYESTDYYYARRNTDGSIRSSFKINTSQPNPWCTSEECKFAIYQEGQIVLEETRENCPEVELIDNICEADISTRVEVTTSPLGFISISEVSLSRDGQSAQDIPDECIDIYNVTPTVPIGGTINSRTGVIFSFVGQYCSDPGCESPTVERDGDDCGESCPEGTCAAICGDYVCCHDTNTGQAVYQIPLENYAGGNS